MRPHRAAWLSLAALVALALCLALSLAVGSVAIPARDLPGLLWHFVWTGGLDGGVPSIILWEVRLPRALLGLGAGCALALAGASLQALFRNHLADPSLIGVSTGAAVGALLALVFGSHLQWPGPLLNLGIVPLGAMAGSLLTSVLVYRLASHGTGPPVSTLLLTGLAVNSLAGAFIGGLVYVASESQLRHYTFWMLGSLAGARWTAALLVLGLTALYALWISMHARSLNVLLLGEAEAFHLGLDVRRLRHRLLLTVALVLGAVTAFCGVIGFVGLMTPHLVRLLVGPDHRRLLPLSALIGGALVTLADVTARSLSSTEVPLGILTSLLGAPFFLFLLRRKL